MLRYAHLLVLEQVSCHISRRRYSMYTVSYRHYPVGTLPLRLNTQPLNSSAQRQHRIQTRLSIPTSVIFASTLPLRSTLPRMALDPDLNTRKYSSKAMGFAARDYNGRTALLKVCEKQWCCAVGLYDQGVIISLRRSSQCKCTIIFNLQLN